MRPNPENAGLISVLLYTGGSLLAAGTFFLAATFGDYAWVGRIGGAVWVFALMMVILMPTVTSLVRAWATGEKVQFASHDHDAMLREEAERHR